MDNDTYMNEEELELVMTICNKCSIYSSCPGDVFPNTVGCEIHKLESVMNANLINEKQSKIEKIYTWLKKFCFRNEKYE